MRISKQKLILTLSLMLAVSINAAWASLELAKVNGQGISKDDLMGALTGVNPAQRSELLKDLETKKQILSSLIDQRLLLQEAQKEKLDRTNDYKEALERFRRSYLVDRILEKNLGGKLTEASARSYYESNKTKYSTDQVHVMHILLSDEKQARDILKMAQAANADFQALAEKYSKDTSAKNNRGDLGFVGRDQLVEAFSREAFRGSPGQIVGPVKTDFGYHVIKIVERKPGRSLTYDESELKVKRDLRDQLAKDYLGRLKKISKITVNEKALQQL